MNISGIVEFSSSLKIIPKRNEQGEPINKAGTVDLKNPAMDHVKFKAVTYKVKADGEVKEDKDGNEIKNEFIFHAYGKLAIKLYKAAQRVDKDGKVHFDQLIGRRISIEFGEIRDIIKFREIEDGKIIESHDGKYIKVEAGAFVGKYIEPYLAITTNLFVFGNKDDKPAVEEKEIKGKDHLIKASLRGSYSYYAGKDDKGKSKHEPVYLNVDSLDSFSDEDEKYKNKTGRLIQFIKAKQTIMISGRLEQSIYTNKQDEVKEWISINLFKFNFSEYSKTPATEVFDDSVVNYSDDDDDFNMAGNDDDLIGDDEIPF